MVRVRSLTDGDGVVAGSEASVLDEYPYALYLVGELRWDTQRPRRDGSIARIQMPDVPAFVQPLLVRLAVDARGGLARSQIADDLGWPKNRVYTYTNRLLDSLTNSLQTEGVIKQRKAAAEEVGRLFVRSPARLGLAPALWITDYSALMQLADEAQKKYGQGQTQEALQLWSAAVELIRGEPLQGIVHPWIATLRVEIRAEVERICKEAQHAAMEAGWAPAACQQFDAIDRLGR